MKSPNSAFPLIDREQETASRATLNEVGLPVPVTLPAANDSRSFSDVHPVRDFLPAPDLAASAVTAPAVDPEIEC